MYIAIDALRTVITEWTQATSNHYWFDQYVLVTFDDKGNAFIKAL